MFLVLLSKLKQWKILKNLEAYNTNDYFSDKFKSSIKFFLMGQGGEDELLNSNNGIGLEFFSNQCLYYVNNCNLYKWWNQHGWSIGWWNVATLLCLMAPIIFYS